MDEQERIQRLEAVLAQMLRPVRDIPFNVVIKALCSKKIIKVDPGSNDDRKLIGKIKAAATICARTVTENPIRRPRPNEVGNDIERYVMEAMPAVGLRPERPSAANGKKQSAGYPDILVYDEKHRPSYLECKIYNYNSEPNTLRSFYLSPSKAPKVSQDARHLLIAFGVEAIPISGSRDSNYFAREFKLVDLHDLLCDVKYEFNSDNRRLYSEGLILVQGEFEA